jgi:AraC family transcriptional regulator, transcriptional activator of pobA
MSAIAETAPIASCPGGRSESAAESTRPVFPWISSRALQFTGQGEFRLDFPPECPLMLHFVLFTMEHRLTPSFHDHLEVSYVHEGRGFFTIEGLRYPMGRGDLIVVGGRRFHLAEASRAGMMKLISLHFMPELIHQTGGPVLDFEYLRPFHCQGPDFSHRVSARSLAPGLVLDRLQRIQAELTAREGDYALAVKTYLHDLLFELSRHFHRNGADCGRPQRGVHQVERLREVFRHIRMNCQEPITLSQAARLAHMSPNYFCRFFKEVTGSTLTEYVVRMRVDLAMEYLANSAMSVTEIAYAAGFSSHSYFDRVFKRLKGVTPLEFRRQIKW